MSLHTTTFPIIVEESKGFQCISMMPSKYNSHIRPVVKYLRRFLISSTIETKYSWKEMLDGLDKEGAPDMDLIKHQTGTISNESKEVRLFTPKITDYMEKVLGASVTPQSKESWNTQLTTIFNNLPMTTSSSFWNITTSANGTKTGCDYSLMSVLPCENGSENFKVLLTTLIIKGEVNETGGWFSSSKSQSYSVAISAATFLVFKEE
ncbi:MAG: hypothetical protein J3R72DRAFT_46643 [Linnemannia gamsii]|nr:MAG: hypothetical protein J3R72DRAFT_46643 [Linnemannia gamsii]